MRRFVFKELSLVSFREKKARKISFDPGMTLIRGNNETGKSSLIKSIFRSFGAEPARVHDRWLSADVQSVIRFSLRGEDYSLLRHGSSYFLFNGVGAPIRRFQSVTKGLAPYLSDLLGFGLRLPNREGAFSPLPPAYFFLPFYMDQDAGWTSQWSSFAKLDQFPNWKRGVIEFHAGIRGNDYYEAQAKRLDAESELGRVQRRREGLQEVYSALQARYEPAGFNVDFSAYRQELDQLLTLCTSLRNREEVYKARLADLRNHHSSLETQLAITLHAREESRQDHEHAVSLVDDDVDCPICGARYTNSFAERFSIAIDEDHCASLALTLKEELADSETRLAKEIADAEKVTEELRGIERLLARREGEVALVDLVRQEGRRELREVMMRDIDDLRIEESRWSEASESALKLMRSLDSRDRRKEVNCYFEDRMRVFLNSLDVHSVPSKSAATVTSTIHETGSELPRALLAFRMAFLYVMVKFGTAVIAPLVIDSPNQQDQDPAHLVRVLRFIREHHPPGTQLVLGLVDTAQVDFPGSEIVLDSRYSLLRESEFPEVGHEVQRLVDTALVS